MRPTNDNTVFFVRRSPQGRRRPVGALTRPPEPGVRAQKAPSSDAGLASRPSSCETLAPQKHPGEVTEWSKVHDWKSCVRQRTAGSNPALSAKRRYAPLPRSGRSIESFAELTLRSGTNPALSAKASLRSGPPEGRSDVSTNGPGRGRTRRGIHPFLCVRPSRAC